MLSLTFFIAQKGLALSRCETWSAGHLHPFSQKLTSQRISELLRKISEDDRQKFLSLWLKKLSEDDYLCYDITSVSSYSRGNEYVAWGYNRDNEKLPQINLALLFGQKRRLPAYYRRLQGNISDVATLQTTMRSLDFLGAHSIHFVLDRGFYSQANVDELLQRRHHFTMAVPAGRKWVEAYIDSLVQSIASPSNYHILAGDEALYAATVLHRWGDTRRRTYLHVYYNAKRAADDFDSFTRQLLQYRQEVLSGARLKDHEEFYERFLVIKQTPQRGLKVEFNDEQVQAYRKRYAGFFCLLSTKIKDPIEALEVYRAKDVVENSYDDLKNQLDMRRLRVHDSTAMDSRLFLQFLALILISKIRTTIQADSKLKNLTVREVMETLETFSKITFSGRYGQLYTETTPLQRQIMKAFNVTLPT